MIKTCARYKLWLFVIFCIAFFGVIYYRLFQLQIQNNAYYLDQQRSYNYITHTTARRDILDRNQSLLVTDTLVLEVTLYRNNNRVIEITNIPSRLGFFEQLVKRLPFWSVESIDLGYFNERLKERYSQQFREFSSERVFNCGRPVLLLRNLQLSHENHIRSIENEELLAYAETFSSSNQLRVRRILRRYINNNRRFDINPQRTYLYEKMASHVLGYLNMVGPQKGAELFLDTVISQEKIRIPRNSLTTISAGRENSSITNSEKGDVVLTIDLDIQIEVEKILRKQLERVSAPKGFVIVMDPNSGEIIALASYPDYNPQNVSLYYQTTLNQERFKNLALQEPFEPGSILKVFPIAAAIEEEIIDIESEFQLHNGSYYFQSIRKRLRDSHPKKTGNVRDIVKYSSNIGTAKIAMKMGPQTLYEYLERFQLDENYNMYAYNRDTIYLPRTRQGIYPLSRWSRQSIAMVPIGHEVSFTGIQLLSSFNALVNGGIFYSPRLVKKIIDLDGVEVLPDNLFSMRVIDSLTSAKMRYLMHSVTEYHQQYEHRGTGSRARFINYSHITTGGKTGTAQYFDLDSGTYHSSRYISSFMGFFPVENPRYTILATVFFPCYEIRYAGECAAPIFSEIGEMILTLEEEKLMVK